MTDLGKNLMSSVSYSNWQGAAPPPDQHPYHQQQQQQQQYSNPESNGPRAKCDQVMFEAIAKASEIIVNGRCASKQLGQYQHQLQQQQQQRGAMYGGSNYMPNNGSNSSRFNLMVPEIASVR